MITYRKSYNCFQKMAHNVTEILDYHFEREQNTCIYIYIYTHTYFLYCTGICHTINPTNQTVKSGPFYLQQNNPLELDSSAQCTLWKTRVLNGCTLFCMFLTYNHSGLLVFSATRCTSSIVSFGYQRVLEKDLN